MNCPVTNNSPKENFSIGILFAPIISFRLNGIYRNNEQIFSGEYSISKEGNNLILYSSSGSQIIPNNFTFIPEDYDSSDFDLLNVIIGINFHWQRTENQKFKGTLKIIDEEKHLTAVNLLPLEDYLLSVISSEMSATSSLELLKAHAVISRSWLIAQKLKNKTLTTDYQSCIQDKHRYIRWYDREDHANFDVCADDHCQRYQGCSKAYTPAVRQAIEATRGEVLTYEGKICDARFSKCCGGVSERFDNTWEPVNHPYLTKIIDSDTLTTVPNLSQEEEAKNGFFLLLMYFATHKIKKSYLMFSMITTKKHGISSVGKSPILPRNYPLLSCPVSELTSGSSNPSNPSKEVFPAGSFNSESTELKKAWSSEKN